MENEKILSPHYLEAYDYFYSLMDNKMYLKQITKYDSIQQVLDDIPKRDHNGFIITFVNVKNNGKNNGKTMHRYVVYGGKAYDMYDGDIEYLKTRVFVLTGMYDCGRIELVHTVHIGYDGLMYDLAGMEDTTYNFETRVIDWESYDDWKLSVFDETDTDKIRCMDFMAFLYSRRLTYGLMTKKDIDMTTEMCVKYGFMKEKSEPSPYLKDILFKDEVIHSKSTIEL